MSPSSSVLREPTMDEILTSIREIIQENTAHAEKIDKASLKQAIEKSLSIDTPNNQPQNIHSSVTQNISVKAANAPILATNPEKVVKNAPESATQNTNLQNINKNEVPQTQKNVQKQNDSLQDPSILSVDDAMQTLAARIGLALTTSKKQEPKSTTENSENHFNNLQTKSASVDNSQEYNIENLTAIVVEDKEVTKETILEENHTTIHVDATKVVGEEAEELTNQTTLDTHQDEAQISVIAENTILDEQIEAQEQTQQIVHAETKQDKQQNSTPEEVQDKALPNLLSGFEDVAEKALRPLISQWLEAQLPNMIEKLLREEMTRVFQKQIDSLSSNQKSHN